MSDTSKPAVWAMDLARGLCGNCHGKGFTQVDGTFRSFRFECADCLENAHALEAAYQRGRDEGLDEAAETNLRCVWDEAKKFKESYKDGWIEATEECARRIRALKSEPSK